MKTLTKLLTVGALIVFGTATLQAANGGRWYVKADAGVTFQSDVEIKSIMGVGLPFTSPPVPEGGLFLDPEDLSGALAGLDLDLPSDSLAGLVAGLQELFPDGYGGIFIPEGTVARLGKPKITWDTGFRIDLAGGYNINDDWSVELETGFIYNTADELKLNASVIAPGMDPLNGSFAVNIKDVFGDDLTMYQVPVLANLIYRVPLECKVKPYVGAGLGGVFTLIDIADESESDFAFAYQVMAGGVYEINDNMELDLSYKLLGSLENDFAGVKTDGTLSHSIVASFTFKF